MLPNCNTSVSNTSSGVGNVTKKCLHWLSDKEKKVVNIFGLSYTVIQEGDWSSLLAPVCLGKCVFFSIVRKMFLLQLSKQNHEGENNYFFIKSVEPLNHFEHKTEMQKDRVRVEQLNYFVLSIHHKGWRRNIYHRDTSWWQRWILQKTKYQR